MRTIRILLISLWLCGVGVMAQNFDDLSFGTPETFDVVTWNLEWFPKNGINTINYVTDIIEALDVDVIAIQEIDSEGSFQILIDNLEGWEGYYMYDEYLALGYLYKTATVEVDAIYEIYTDDTYFREFPRPPLVMEMTFQGVPYILINNHLKCCGNNDMNLNDLWDEETRRYDACNLIDDFISLELPTERVIMLGDLNDELTDSFSDNVFATFLSNNTEYWFADMLIAEGDETEGSYPSYPSHIDHILITNELFEDFDNTSETIDAIALEDYFPGELVDYDYYVSDHRPVGIKLQTEEITIGIEEAANTPASLFLRNHPNPSVDATTFSFYPIEAKAQITIYNAQGQIVETLPLAIGQTSLTWEAKKLARGVYLAQLSVAGQMPVNHNLVISQ